MLPGELRQVPAELVEDGRAARVLLGPCRSGGGTDGLAALVAGEQLDDLLADTGQVGAESLEDLCGDTLTLAHEAQQHVLGPDVVVTELERFAQ